MYGFKIVRIVLWRNALKLLSVYESPGDCAKIQIRGLTLGLHEI